MPGYPISTVSDIGCMFEYDRSMDLLPDDADGTLAAVEAALAAKRAAEARILELAAHWADLHPKESLFPGASAVPGGERAGLLGGEGTPLVAEFCPAELAMTLEVSDHAARALMADALDLRHRLPDLWSLVRNAQLESWVARKVARLTRSVSTLQAEEIDDRIADVAASLPPGRLFRLVESLVLACDTTAAEERRQQALASRFVTVNQSTEHGTKGLYAKLDTVDAIRLDARIDQVAAALKSRGDEASIDVRRAKALGLLADPDTVQHLIGGADVEPTRPPVVAYVHLDESAFTRDADGVARFHDGRSSTPITLEHAREILGHSHVTIRPVIDLATITPRDAYEFTGSLREAVLLRTPTDCFPHATNQSHRMQIDHTQPYDTHGPPGQTRLDNAGPLGARHHRIATHGQWRRRQVRSGIFVWQTPHRRYLTTGPDGTRALDPEFGARLFDDHQRLEQGFADFLLDYAVAN